MRRNCNLELRLFTPSDSYASQQEENDVVEQIPMSLDGIRSRIGNERQQMTIFYDNEVVTCDVTELQARAIIMIASEERWKTTVSEPSSPLMQPQLCRPPALATDNGLSMKKSLQRFLHKRKNRVQSTPYHR
ncbi:unnamed protein product [Cuscuta epithymum]|uniref:Protein TIFY n=1 Tax=Cuscuta epithymum TaxID=186058 RepID=A0AAV0FRD4_9ASTE|nr:unnamed protein product [Cuscuta epithymum]